MIIDSHRGKVTVVDQSKSLDLVEIGWNTVQFHHDLSLASPGFDALPRATEQARSGTRT
ncbi:MAG: hypothetical protein ACRDTX_23165 [Pseudonocardiaceae bacterium]